jgi:tetratricopeptide (TPR) repeat protein
MMGMCMELKNNIISLTVIGLLCLWASSIHAQELRPTTVHISGPTSQTPFVDKQKIADVIGSMLELKLNELKNVQIVATEPTCDDVVAGPPRLHVKSSLNAQPRPGSSTLTIKEVVLEYDLVKLVREDDPQKRAPCREILLLHRSEPVSLKTAFGAIVRMCNLLKAGVEEETAPAKIMVDMVAFTASGVSLQLKDRLNNAILSKLAGEEDFEVRTFADKAGSDSDYVVTGELDPQGASFLVRNVKSGKAYRKSVRGRVTELNVADLTKFLETAATTVANTLREDRNPVRLTVSDASTAVNQALICKRNKPDADCISEPALVLPELLRLKDSEQASPQILGLLGDTYVKQEEFQKAADAYDEAFETSTKPNLPEPSKATPRESLSFLLSAAGASYKAQQYAGAGARYDRAIEFASKNNPVLVEPDLFVQAARSHRFAREPLEALDRALRGLKMFPDSAELDTEVTESLRGMSDATQVAGYEMLVRYKDIRTVASRLAQVKDSMTYYLEQPLALFLDQKYRDAEPYLKLAESLGVESLPQAAQIEYRVARAVLQREAGTDTAVVISTLEPYAKDETEVSLPARYFLAETLYKRARSTTASGKADYERASTLLRRIADKFPQRFVLELLVKTNHEIGKDEETRVFLQQLLDRQQAPPDAPAALVMLCVDYIGDLVCGERAITDLGPREQLDRETLLRLGSIYVFWARYAEANNLVTPVYVDPNRSLLEVELFYRVWIALAVTTPANAQALFEAWKKVMESMRAAGETTQWVFTPAAKALESEQALRLPQYKELLRRMIAAMTDPKQPLPTANLVSPVGASPAQ